MHGVCVAQASDGYRLLDLDQEFLSSGERTDWPVAKDVEKSLGRYVELPFLDKARRELEF
jgi:hypothetical protein